MVSLRRQKFILKSYNYYFCALRVFKHLWLLVVNQNTMFAPHASSELTSVSDPDPGSGAFWTPRSPNPYFWELRDNFVGKKYYNSLSILFAQIYLPAQRQNYFQFCEICCYTYGFTQCCGTVTIFYGSGSGSDFEKLWFQVMVLVPVPSFEKLRFRFRFQLHIYTIKS